MSDAERKTRNLGAKLRYLEDADLVMRQLALCAAWGIPEALVWCEELEIQVRSVNPIGLIPQRILEKWAAKCVMEKAAYMDELCRYIIGDDEIMQAGAWQEIYAMAETGDAMALILKHVGDGIYASNILKRSVLAREHVWPDVVKKMSEL